MEEEKPELNITPLVDVMLVLVAILMLTMPMLLFEERIALPKGSKQAQVKENADIWITLTAKKEIFVNKKQFEYDSFPDSFVLYANQFPDRKRVIFLAADGSLRYDDVVYVIKSVKAARFTQVSLVTE
ncbi:MAG: biopolymer transporter ExbD [Helicobacteraceae bacterium]|jgi:biopolymer transport protein ExbD|nr:biopolymer transporter ExbD [Helicobacteraceae bacterium]